MSPTRNLSPNTDNSFMTSHAALDQYLIEESNKVCIIVQCVVLDNRNFSLMCSDLFLIMLLAELVDDHSWSCLLTDNHS